jgi:hypothetical protein
MLALRAYLVASRSRSGQNVSALPVAILGSGEEAGKKQGAGKRGKIVVAPWAASVALF